LTWSFACESELLPPESSPFALASTIVLAAIAIDTAGMAPGLAATSPRSYEMRGTIPDYARLTAGTQNYSVTRFGDGDQVFGSTGFKFGTPA